MKNYKEWFIFEALQNKKSEIYCENFIGNIKSEGGAHLEGKTIYTVVDSDDIQGTVTLEDNNGDQLTFETKALTKALAEDNGPTGFQALQYPVGYIMGVAGTDLAKLSIYDSRLKKKSKKEKNQKHDK